MSFQEVRNAQEVSLTYWFFGVGWGGCVLQVSALQQGAGVRDGVAAEEEGTMELGPKRMWKVGNGELFSRDRSGRLCLPRFSRILPAFDLGLSVISPLLFPLLTPLQSNV